LIRRGWGSNLLRVALRPRVDLELAQDLILAREPLDEELTAGYFLFLLLLSLFFITDGRIFYYYYFLLLTAGYFIIIIIIFYY
jgi:hypothetical protein